jgi:hypothetical protein
MNKIKEILISYAKTINPSKEDLVIAEIRLETCMDCEQWKVNALGIQYCEMCGCALKGKVFSPRGVQACTLSKWKI